MEDGTIHVFDNRVSESYSGIVEIDPKTFERPVLVDGREHGFYSRIRGKHQRLPDGTIAVISTQQGRALEVA
ncbi:MAG: hypothetical protein ACFBWO_00355 [Paracoccaceae bacterium]